LVDHGIETVHLHSAGFVPGAQAFDIKRNFGAMALHLFKFQTGKSRTIV